MTISRMLGCNELNPWIRDVYNVTLKNGTSTDELPGHLNLCFFDTIVVSAWSVFAGMVLLYIMYHLTKHHAVETNHKKWSKSIVRWRYVNLIFPSILFVLSSIVLFEDTYNLPRFDEKAAYMEGYDLKTTNRGLIIGSTAQCLSYMIVLVSVYLSSTDRQIWHVPRGIRWWILAWTVASFVRIQCTIEAIVGYESMINWPFGELNDVENQKFIQWLRLIRFVFLFIYSIAILGQRDTPSFGFDVSPSDEQLRLAMKEDSEQEETKVSTLREPLLEDAESDDEENVETKTTSTVRFDPSWLPQDAPRGADRILRRVHSLDTRSEMHERVNQKVQRSDEMGASIFESLTFSWMNDQVRAGKQAPLQTRQLHLLHGNDLPDINAEKMLEMYRKLGGGEKCDETFRKKASVAWTIFYVYKWPLLFAASLSTFKVLVTLAQPMILQEVIKSIVSPVEDEDKNELQWAGFFWCTLYVVFMLMSTIITMQVNRTMGRVGAKIRGGFTAMIYSKGLRLTSAARAAVGEGKIVSLMEVDCAKLEWGLWTCMNVYQLILLLVGAIILLWILAGVSSLASLIVMVILFIPSAWAMSNAIPHWPKTMALKDRRVRLLTELLQSMKLTKALGWEGAMLDRVQRQRKDEATERFMLVSWFSVLWSIGMSSPIFINLATLVWFVVSTGKTLTASLGAPLFQLTSIIQGPVNGLPTSLGVLLQVQVSINRIDTFLKQPETRTGVLKKDNDGTFREAGVERPAVVHEKVKSDSTLKYCRSDNVNALGKEKNDDRYVAIRARNVYADWGQIKDMDESIFEERKRNNADARKSGCCARFFRIVCGSLCCCLGNSRKQNKDQEKKPSDKTESSKEDDDSLESKEDGDDTKKKKKKKKSITTLRFDNLTVRQGDLVVVLGKVGSGKSTLLASLLNEVGMRDGSYVRVAGKIAYCAQQPWIQNLNLRQNILFGSSYDAKRYAHAVTSASLWEDFMQLPDGDATEIGERGLTLSGGQKARVALARAVYADADIYLLDDVFSAVDAHVALELAKRCVLGTLKNKTRVLVTHATGLLSLLAEHSKDRLKIVVLENGKIEHVGSYDEIMSLNLDVTSVSRADLGGDGTTEDEKDVSIDAPKLSKVKSSASTTSTTAKGKNKSRKLVRDEDRAVGSVKFVVWKHFFVTFGFKYTVIFMVSALCAGCARLANGFWLADWMDSGDHDKQIYYTVIYSVLQMATVIFVITWVVDLAFGRYNMSIVIHRKSLWGVFRSPMVYFDSTRLGRIINRFSSDLSSVDTDLCWNVILFINSILYMSFSLSYILLTNIWIVALVLPCSYFYYHTMQMYRGSARELKRLCSVTRSPVFSAFTEALNGVSTVRAYRVESRFNEKHLRRLELNIGANLNQQALSQWMDVRLSLISILLLAPVIFMGLLQHLQGWNLSLVGKGFTAGVFAIAIGKCSEVSGGLESLIRQFASAETSLVCMERLLALQKLPSEPALFIKGEEDLKRENDELRERAARAEHGDDETKSVKRNQNYVELSGDDDDDTVAVSMDSWPTAGKIEFRKVSMRYRSDLPKTLRGLSFTIPAGSSVGIVGRTGAGKSSLIQALFRLTPIESDGGQILIDDMNITTEIGLHKLRTRLALIPQDPVLFSGTVRGNLDPFQEYKEKDLWEALELVQLGDFVRASTEDEEKKEEEKTSDDEEKKKKNPLDMTIAERGENLSVGQRQLLCLARALLRRSKILVMDEATASVDGTTDRLIQDAITTFVSKTKSTVLTIAHRIDTIINNDLIIVMDKGRVSEMGTPRTLLKDPTSEFTKLYEESRRNGKDE